jgi:signal transduction histidine kinase
LWFIDGGFAVVVTAVLITLVLVPAEGRKSTAALVVGLVLALVQGGSLVWLHARPERVMAAAMLAGIGLQIVAPYLGWLGLAGAALCGLASLRPPRVSLWALGAMLALTPWRLIEGGRAAFGISVLATGLSWAIGELMRSRRARRENEGRRVVAEERARIARELHDIVAHTLSVIIVQAGAAEDAFEERPDQARQALRAVDASARTALGELRTLLRGMGADDAADPNAPQPGLEQVDGLAAAIRAAGLAVRLRREGGEVPVPAGVDLSAYRIVQESLTNTLRHAHATSADVLIRYGKGSVDLVITDDGQRRGGGDPAGGQRGIVGMRERARLLGGTLDAEPMPRGGFQVRAHLPLQAAS